MDAPCAHIDASVSKAISTLRPISLTGLFGGDTAVAAMGTVHLFAHRWICGWYNTPGSYEIAKRYGQLANVWFWDGLFPGGTHDPSELFKLNGMKGPPFLGAHSGSKYPHTGHLAYLLARKAHDMEPTFPLQVGDAQSRTVPKSVTIFDLRAARLPIGKDLTPYLRTGLPVYISLIILLFNLLLAAISWLVGDGLCASIICLGIAANGIACLVLGWGTLAFHGHVPAEGAPPGDGILYNDDGVLILLGGEPVISSILRGRFFVRYSSPALPFRLPTFIWQCWEALIRHYTRYEGYIRLPSNSTDELTMEEGSTVEPPFHHSSKASDKSAQGGATSGRALERPSSILVACCSFLLLGQFVTQLLIIPLGTPPGQVLYIFSLAASWLYNAYLASHNREDIQTEILFKMLRVEEGRICKVRCDFRTPMAVFTALVLQGHSRAADPKPSASSTSSAPSPDPSPDDVPYLLPYSDKHLQVENGRTLRIALQNPTKILNGIIPNDTKVWTDWKKHVGKAITRTLYPDQGGPLNPAAGWSDIPSTSSGAETASGTRPSPVEEEERLIRRLYGYANDGQRMYHAWLEWCASRTHT